MIVFDAHAADTPAGKFTGVPMPVAPVVVWVIAVRDVLIHNVGVDDPEPAVLTVAIISACPFIVRRSGYICTCDSIDAGRLVAK